MQLLLHQVSPVLAQIAQVKKLHFLPTGSSSLHFSSLCFSHQLSKFRWRDNNLEVSADLKEAFKRALKPKVPSGPRIFFLVSSHHHLIKTLLKIHSLLYVLPQKICCQFILKIQGMHSKHRLAIHRKK